MKLIKFETVGREHIVNPAYIIELHGEHYEFGKFWKAVRVLGGDGCTEPNEYRLDEENYNSILEQLKSI